MYTITCFFSVYPENEREKTLGVRVVPTIKGSFSCEQWKKDLNGIELVGRTTSKRKIYVWFCAILDVGMIELEAIYIIWLVLLKEFVIYIRWMHVVTVYDKYGSMILVDGYGVYVMYDFVKQFVGLLRDLVK